MNEMIGFCTLRFYGDNVLPRKILSISPFTSTQKSLISESSPSVLQLYAPEYEDVADFILSVLILPSESMFIPDFGKSFIPSSCEQVWFAGFELSHCSLVRLPASADLFFSASGTAENQIGAIGISID